jgi:hypothetical protein
LIPTRRLPALLVVAALALAARPAFAQQASNKAAAEALFQEGRKLYDAGSYPQACAKFAESERLDPAAGTLLNLAGCYEKNGQTASAWATFKEAMSAAHQKGRSDWEDMARARAAALEPGLSRLTIAVSATADGLEVRRDGEVVGKAEWGTAIPVDPGTHVVEARAPHRQTSQQSIDVKGAGASATVTVTELAPEVAGGPTGDSGGGGSSSQRTIGIAVGALGIVGIAVGSVFGVVAMSKENEALHNDCTGDKYCNPQGLQLGQDANSAATASTIAFTVGAVALAGGLVLYFTAPKSREPTAPAVGLRATPTRGGATFGLEAAW